MTGTLITGILSNRLKSLIEKNSVSIQRMGKDIGIAPGAISNYQNDKAEPGANAIYKICDYMGVTSDYLLGLCDVPTTDTTIQAICNHTGLSDDFASWLSSHKDYAPQIEKLSKPMIDNGFIGGDNSEQE